MSSVRHTDAKGLKSSAASPTPYIYTSTMPPIPYPPPLTIHARGISTPGEYMPRAGSRQCDGRGGLHALHDRRTPA